jgi:hypothetical protein
MIRVTTKPQRGFYYIKLQNHYIVSDNEKPLLCLLKALQESNHKVLSVRYKLGSTSKVILLDLRKNPPEVKELTQEDWEAIKLSYPFAKEIVCKESPEDKKLLKQIKKAGGLLHELQKNYKRIALYTVLIGVSLYLMKDFLIAPEEDTVVQPSQPSSVVSKVVTHDSPNPNRCLTNLYQFVENFVVGAKVELNNQTSLPEILYQTKEGVIKLPLKGNKVLPLKETPQVKTFLGVRVKRDKLGYLFEVKDYDLCLEFIRENTHLPLYIVSLDEKGCKVYLFSTCLSPSGSGANRSTTQPPNPRGSGTNPNGNGK